MASRSPMRELLRRLHEVMAARNSVQGKLDQVAGVIAAALKSDVASIYLVRDGHLELFATEGLKQAAVHVTRLDFGQGLVGLIAETAAPLSLADARGHPNFAYRPETGEERFRSFAGVPIIRREQTVGVLSVQHVHAREYSDEEIEALQTVAMVLAELIAASGLLGGRESSHEEPRDLSPLQLEGLKLVDGLGRGTAVFHHPRPVILRGVADDPAVERERLREAFQRMRAEIDQMVSRAEFAGPGDHDDILETYKMFALDEGWARRIHDGIDGGLTAEAAIDAVARAQKARLGASADPYLRERLHDLEDLSNRLIRVVSGQSGTAAARGLAGPSILVARNLGPAELLEYDRRHLHGIVLEDGSLTSHVTILARAMGIPMLGRVHDARRRVGEGDPLLLDAATATLFVRPPATVLRGFDEQMALKERRQAEFRSLRDLPAETLDGVRVTLMMNAGLRTDLPALKMTNADGIGLFRTEFQFLVSSALPRMGRQVALYRDVLEAAGDKPVVFRTVDIGGDKAVPYVGERAGHEENPAMGWRAIRLALDRPGLLAAQGNALLEAAAGKPLNLMFPMVTEPWEFRRARAIIEKRVEKRRKAGQSLPSELHFGAMLEVPLLALLLDDLLPHVDFLSIGTNDLTQFLMAADRGNPVLADRYDWLSPGVLRYLQRVLQPAAAARVPVSICGEMGGRPLEALALLALGAERLSITPAGIGRVKAMIRSVRILPLRERMAEWLSMPGADIRARLQKVVADERIRVD